MEGYWVGGRESVTMFIRLLVRMMAIQLMMVILLILMPYNCTFLVPFIAFGAFIAFSSAFKPFIASASFIANFTTSHKAEVLIIQA